MNIVFWADLQCPYCYTGEVNLKHAIEELAIEDQIRMDIKAYEIHDPADGNGEMPMIEIFQRKEGMAPEQAAAQIAAVNKMASSEAGLDFDFGKVRESNDRKAHRLYKLARDHGKGPEVRHALHELYFSQEKILDEDAVLKEAARMAGLDEALVEEMLEQGWYENEVIDDEMELDALNAESVPYFLFDQEVVPEHLTKEGYIEVLKRHMK